MENDNVKFCYNADIIKEVLEDSRKSSDNKGMVTGISTGFYELDFMTAGFQKGDLVLLSGRTGSGKTSLALSIVNTILKAGKKVAYFSLNHTAKKIMTGLLSINSKVKVWDISNGTVKEDELEKLQDGADATGGLQLTIEDNPYNSALDIKYMSRMLKRMGGLDFIVIDGFQYLASYPGTPSCYMRGQRSGIAQMLKRLAIETECPILLVMPLTQQGELTDNKRPDIYDLGAADFEALHSDVIMLLHEVNEDEYDLILAKNRSGREGVVKLRPCLEYSKYENFSPKSNKCF